MYTLQKGTNCSFAIYKKRDHPYSEYPILTVFKNQQSVIKVQGTKLISSDTHPFSNDDYLCISKIN